MLRIKIISTILFIQTFANAQSPKLFSILPSTTTGITFRNDVVENEKLFFFIRTLCVHKSTSKTSNNEQRLVESKARKKLFNGYLYLLDPGGKLSWLSGYAKLSGKF